ncbi:MAG: hypothetical protein KC618_08845, partial [Candidatus Omnitrophica bacterium]|nr:hypothetical protein [Candidatus Omnitrophota bacterium]
TFPFRDVLSQSIKSKIYQELTTLLEKKAAKNKQENEPVFLNILFKMFCKNIIESYRGQDFCL